MLAQAVAANPYDPTAVKPRNPASSLVVPLTTEVPGEVDGLSNKAEILFDSVVANTTSLLFSVQNDGNIYFERQDSASGSWATAATIDGMNAPNDVDGLEIWGPEVMSDADRYSLQGDRGFPGGPGVAIWGYDVGTHTSTPILLSTTLAGLIGLETVLLDQLDLDAMMVNPGAEAEPIIFSIAPVMDASGAVLFDGASVPEPGIGALPGAGLVVLALLGRRSR